MVLMNEFFFIIAVNYIGKILLQLNSTSNYIIWWKNLIRWTSWLLQRWTTQQPAISDDELQDYANHRFLEHIMYLIYILLFVGNNRFQNHFLSMLVRASSYKTKILSLKNGWMEFINSLIFFICLFVCLWRFNPIFWIRS